MFDFFKKVVPKEQNNLNSKKPKIKAVIFDVGGVLLLSKRGGIHQYIVKRLDSNMEKWLEFIENFWPKIVENESNSLLFITNLKKEYQLPQSKLEKLLVKAFRKRFKKNRPLFKLIKKLNKKHYTTAIFSNQSSFSYQAFKKYNFEKKVHLTLFSHKEGMKKPHINFYKLLLKRLKLPAKNCLFIDNHDWNLAPARKLGINTLLYTDNKQLFKQLKEFKIKW